MQADDTPVAIVCGQQYRCYFLAVVDLWQVSQVGGTTCRHPLSYHRMKSVRRIQYRISNVGRW